MSTHNGVLWWERARQPHELLDVGEEPTTCTHCGARTMPLLRKAVLDPSARVEQCSHCGQIFDVVDEDPTDLGDIEVVDEATGEVVGTTAASPGMPGTTLDSLLHELGAPLPEVTRADLNHLFSIKEKESPYGDIFGSF